MSSGKFWRRSGWVKPLTSAKALAAHPLNQIEQVHPDIENDAALRRVFAPRRAHGQAGGALQRDRREAPEASRGHNLSGASNGRIEADLMRDAQNDPGRLTGVDHVAGVRRAHGERLFAQNMFAATRRRQHSLVMHVVG